MSLKSKESSHINIKFKVLKLETTDFSSSGGTENSLMYYIKVTTVRARSVQVPLPMNYTRRVNNTYAENFDTELISNSQ
jgi:hypothetical protein